MIWLEAAHQQEFSSCAYQAELFAQSASPTRKGVHHTLQRVNVKKDLNLKKKRLSLTPSLLANNTHNQNPLRNPARLGSSREAVLVLLAVLVAGVLLECRALGGRLEVLEADLALDALGGEVLCKVCQFAVDIRTRCRFFCPEGEAHFRKKEKKKRTDLS